jgi:hypothetical protein
MQALSLVALLVACACGAFLFIMMARMRNGVWSLSLYYYVGEKTGQMDEV